MRRQEWARKGSKVLSITLQVEGAYRGLQFLPRHIPKLLENHFLSWRLGYCQYEKSGRYNGKERAGSIADHGDYQTSFSNVERRLTFGDPHRSKRAHFELILDVVREADVVLFLRMPLSSLMHTFIYQKDLLLALSLSIERDNLYFT